MGDQQQRIDALRAAMTSIQERDPDAPVPDFLVVDTSVSVEPVETRPAPAGPPGAQPAASGPADGSGDAESGDAGSGDAGSGDAESGEAESGDDEFADPDFEDLESGDLEFVASAAGRPLIEPDQLSDAPVSFSTGESAPAEVQARSEDRDGLVAKEVAEAEDEPPAEGMAALRPEEQYEKARAVVLRRLTGSPKSRHQLAVALKEKEFSPEVITRVLDRMEEVHLVNDTDFAQTWVRGRHELKNLGKSALRRELREKGISEPVAQEALEQISAEDEGEAARELVRRKLQGKPVPTGPSPEERAERDKVTRRLVSMLARRGHAPGVAFQIVREMIQEHAGE